MRYNGNKNLEKNYRWEHLLDVELIIQGLLTYKEHQLWHSRLCWISAIDVPCSLSCRVHRTTVLQHIRFCHIQSSGLIIDIISWGKKNELTKWISKVSLHFIFFPSNKKGPWSGVAGSNRCFRNLKEMVLLYKPGIFSTVGTTDQLWNSW